MEQLFERVEKTIKRIKDNYDPRYDDIVDYNPIEVLKQLHKDGKITENERDYGIKLLLTP